MGMMPDEIQESDHSLSPAIRSAVIAIGPLDGQNKLTILHRLE
jgi:hypothetical protein